MGKVWFAGPWLYNTALCSTVLCSMYAVCLVREVYAGEGVSFTNKEAKRTRTAQNNCAICTDLLLFSRANPAFC